MTTPSLRSLKICTSLPNGNMIIFYNCHLNQNHFQMVCHKATSHENVMCFKFKYVFFLLLNDIISLVSTAEDTRTKSLFIMHFRRHNNLIEK